jgi:hypothetical protein
MSEVSCIHEAAHAGSSHRGGTPQNVAAVDLIHYALLRSEECPAGGFGRRGIDGPASGDH